MSRVRLDSKVRRCLFPRSDEEEQAKVDNFHNILQEAAAREIEEKSNKYGFDFKSDRPLDNKYKWRKNKDSNSKFDWIGEKITEEDAKENEKTIPVQSENEKTPVQVREESVPALRKRKRDAEKVGNTSAKRKVDFN
ncbi:unnamed protein product [Chrysodeixis includens]|uniref:Cyclin-dependent kinase inhibitor domain-containing protein n=1 Tax=Chrysodeixis includens TaxID=689277 RepID=A0A9P0BQH0_CHRIL|nr:unnamed protein product [Chrysodeixis includens]